MSRNIDMSDLSKLSPEDVLYLRQRGRTDVVAELDRIAAMKKVEQIEVEEPYSEWKVDDLRDELRNRELDDEGKKDVLVARLEADDTARDAATA
jgi:hypothetical protein